MTITRPGRATGAGERPSPLRLTPGLLLACGLAAAGVAAAQAWSMASPLLVAIVLGVIVGNAVRLPASVRPGLQVAGRRLLRIGIVLLGIQLPLGTVLGLGPGMVLTVVAVVGVGVTATYAVGRRLGLSHEQSLLIGCGFSICGAAAVAAADGVIDAEDEDVATSIALVVVFGTLMIAVLPFLAGLLGLSSRDGGLWAGASVHEVAQVVATAGVIGGGALGVAVVVKLARVLMLAPVLAVLGWLRRRTAARGGGSVTTSLPPLVPLFVLGFIALVALRSVAPPPAEVVSVAKQAETFLLAAAMGSLGIGVRLDLMRRVGGRPLLLGLIGTAVVTGIGLGGVVVGAG
jgi:uncharacterized integral membrane protein (TIGR00698 family)